MYMLAPMEANRATTVSIKGPQGFTPSSHWPPVRANGLFLSAVAAAFCRQNSSPLAPGLAFGPPLVLGRRVVSRPATRAAGALPGCWCA